MGKSIRVWGMFFCFLIMFLISSNRALAIDNNSVKCEKNIEMYQYKVSDMEYYDGKFFTAGSDGMIKTSVDGHKWDLINVPTTKSLTKVLCIGTNYTIIGGNSVFSSKDGLTWSSNDFEYLAGSLKDIVWNGEKYIVVGDFGSIYSSPDCVEWEKEISNVQGTISSIVWNGKKFVAVGGDRTSNGFIITSDDGIKWTRSSFAPVYGLNGVIWTGEKFIVVGYKGEIIESLDGESWNKVDSGIGDDLYDIEYNGDIFIAVGSNAAIITSQNGTQWRRVNESSSNIKLKGVTWGNGKFIAADETITMESTDGVKWIQSEADYDKYFHKIAYNRERFVIVGGSYDSGGIIYTSDDGKKWSEGHKGLPYLLRDIIWSDNKFITVGESGAILTSNDGVTWTKSNSATDNELHSILWDGKNYFAVGDDGVLITSSDGITWRKIDISSNSDFYDISYNGNQYIIVGDNGSIFISNNGVEWKAQNSGSNSLLLKAVWNGQKYIVLAGLGTIESNDGITWNKTSVYWPAQMNDIVWSEDMFIAVGWAIDGTSSIKISEDGIKWYSVSNVTSSCLQGMIKYEDKFIAVGWNGTIVNGVISSDIPKILVNGKLLELDVPPENIDDRLLVPVRAIFEAMGASVEWDDSTNTIKATKGNTVIELQINNKSAKVNGNQVLLVVPALLKNNRTLVPVRFISESLGAKVEWDSESKTVQITTESKLEQIADEKVTPDVKSTGKPNLKSISAGEKHTVALFDDGTVWAWGDNYYGQLGNGSNENSNIPVKLEDLNNIISVSCGDNYTLALKDDGTVWGWGFGAFHPSGIDTNKAVQIEGLYDVTAISAGNSYSFAVMKDGTVWTWGLMPGLEPQYSVMTKKPVKVLGLENIIAVSTLFDDSLALKNDGTVWTWGTHVGPSGFVAYQIDGLSDVQAIAAGGSYNFVLKRDGSVWQVVHGGKGSIKKIEGLENIISISAGQYHSVALSSDGSAWIWGNYYNGSDNLWNYGTYNYQYQPVQVLGLNNISKIYSGYNHTFAVSNDDTIWSWGNNRYGQLGDGSNNSRNVPLGIERLSNKSDLYINQNIYTDGKEFFLVWMKGIDGITSEDKNTVRGTPVKCIFK